MEHHPVLEVRNLAKTFRLHERQTTIRAFHDLNFAAQAGRFTILVGASGAGKSSALKCIYRSYLADEGQILFRDAEGNCVDLRNASEQQILRYRRWEIRMVSQFLHVLPRQSAVDVVARPLLALSDDAAGRRTRSRETARELLHRLGLPERLWNVPPFTFSGGERQLVNLAHALAVRPRLLLLDEPTASLDPASTERIVAALEGVKGQGVAMVGVFHNRALVDRLADARIELAGGVMWHDASEETSEIPVPQYETNLH
jgi:alpha-D-ribose 1-methylphosphonate 5-triphosphate synthase subunit PhnL